MSEGIYCEPCCRLLRGDLLVRSNSRDPYEVWFDHHLDYDSFDRAMRLPCSICNLAWANRGKSPYDFRRETVRGQYHYSPSDDERTLMFFVDVYNGGTWSSRLFLEQISSFADFPACPTLPSDTGHALRFLLEQYQHCRAHHEQCSNAESLQGHQYPLRLLDVGLEGSPVVLRSTKMFSDREYVCLSHCWGETKPYALNSTTQRDLERGIDAADFPKTFRDAVHVTRCLGMQYLWIDSLCILQDSEPDWAAESARMDQIYARAACTIAATASTGSDGGLFHERSPEPLLPRLLNIQFPSEAAWLEDKHEKFRLDGTYLCDIEDMATYCIENAPLNTRAWVSQERQLSRRTMHFSDSQLFWECHGRTTCETYPQGIPDRALPYWYDDATMLKRRLHKFEQQQETYSDGESISLSSEPGLTAGLYWAWCSFRIKYSASALTRPSDKLVALQGIAQHVSRLTGDELIAGLWKSRMVEELCWHKRFEDKDSGPKPKEWRAPTWSWAASNSVTWIGQVSKFHRRHERRSFEIKIIDIDVGTKLSGELTHGTMRIICKPMLALVIPEVHWLVQGYELDGHLKLIEDDSHASAATNDEEERSIASRLCMDFVNFFEPQKMYIVVMQRCLHGGFGHDDEHNKGYVSDPGLEDGNGDIVQVSDNISTVRSHPGIGSMNSEPNQKVGPEGKDLWDIDMLEGLLLQLHDEDSATFSRIGMLHLEGPEATRLMLEAHFKAEERIITLV